MTLSAGNDRVLHVGVVRVIFNDFVVDILHNACIKEGCENKAAFIENSFEIDVTAYFAPCIYRQTTKKQNTKGVARLCLTKILLLR